MLAVVLLVLVLDRARHFRRWERSFEADAVRELREDGPSLGWERIAHQILFDRRHVVAGHLYVVRGLGKLALLLGFLVSLYEITGLFGDTEPSSQRASSGVDRAGIALGIALISAVGAHVAHRRFAAAADRVFHATQRRLDATVAVERAAAGAREPSSSASRESHPKPTL